MPETIAPSTAQPTPARRFQCRHIHTDGRRCASPALREQELCFFHQTSRSAIARPKRRRGRQVAFDLPIPEDRSAIQLSIGEVLRRVASNDVDPRRAGLLLYGLQIASNNLPRAAGEPASTPIEDITFDPLLGTLAPTAELPSTSPHAHRRSLSEILLEELGLDPNSLNPAPSTPYPVTPPSSIPA